MSFQPILVGTGLTAWSLLQRSMPAQREIHDQLPEISRDTEYFKENIASVTSAAELVEDRRLLRVALGAFGLGDDINNRAFVQQILEGGSETDDALANRLVDSRYREFAKAFGFGNLLGARTGDVGFAQDITARFRDQAFETAIGDQDQSMRIALYSQRKLPQMVDDGSNSTVWLRIMGDPAMRSFFETALGLPQDVSQIDLDQQIEIFDDRLRDQLRVSELSELTDPDVLEKLTQRYLLRDQINSSDTVLAGSAALTLLQAGRSWS